MAEKGENGHRMPKYNISIDPSELSKTERRKLTKAAKKAAQAKVMYMNT